MWTHFFFFTFWLNPFVMLFIWWASCQSSYLSHCFTLIYLQRPVKLQFKKLNLRRQIHKTYRDDICFNRPQVLIPKLLHLLQASLIGPISVLWFEVINLVVIRCETVSADENHTWSIFNKIKLNRGTWKSDSESLFPLERAGLRCDFSSFISSPASQSPVHILSPWLLNKPRQMAVPFRPSSVEGDCMRCLYSADSKWSLCLEHSLGDCATDRPQKD